MKVRYPHKCCEVTGAVGKPRGQFHRCQCGKQVYVSVVPTGAEKSTDK